jgi:hypothetical protein
VWSRAQGGEGIGTKAQSRIRPYIYNHGRGEPGYIYVAGKALMHRALCACLPLLPVRTNQTIIGLGLKLTKHAPGACESSTAPARAPHHLSIPAQTSDGMQRCRILRKQAETYIYGMKINQYVRVCLFCSSPEETLKDDSAHRSLQLTRRLSLPCVLVL